MDLCNYTTQLSPRYITNLAKRSFYAIDILCACISIVLGGCPFHGRVERDEIPTRESPPKQSGTLPCPALPSPPLHSTPVPSTPLPPLCRLLLSISMHAVCEVGQLNWIGPLSLDYPGVAVRQWHSRPSSRCYFNGPLLHSAYILH